MVRFRPVFIRGMGIYINIYIPIWLDFDVIGGFLMGELSVIYIPIWLDFDREYLESKVAITIFTFQYG